MPDLVRHQKILKSLGWGFWRYDSLKEFQTVYQFVRNGKKIWFPLYIVYFGVINEAIQITAAGNN